MPSFPSSANGDTSQLPPNRALDTLNEDNALVMDLMKIDETIVNYISEYINPTVTLNDAQIPVPLVFSTPERWNTIQTDGVLRKPNSEQIETPLMIIRRVSMERGELDKPINKYLEYVYETDWNKQNTYDRFAAVNRVKPSKKFKTVIIPDYVTLTYNLVLWTAYQSQMNELVEQLNPEDHEYWGPRNDFKFRMRFGAFTSDSELPPEGDRVIRLTTSLSVQAYLIPQKVLQNYKQTSTNSVKYSGKKIITFVESESR